MIRSSPTFPFIPRRPSRFFKIALACLGISLWAGPLPGQEAIRPSVAGEAAAALRKQPIQTTDYNLEVGPVLLKVTGGIGVQYNDNINLSETGRQADIIVSPAVNINLNWPVTRSNTLSLTTSLGYQEYIFHPQNASPNITVAPNSQLNFDIYTGSFRINFHDQFSASDNPIQVGALSNVTTYAQYSNTIGAGILWDLNSAILTVDLDYTNIITPTSQDQGNQSAIPDDTHATESAVFSALFPVTPITGVGFNTNASYTTYSQSDRGTATTFGAGPFFQTRLTSFTQLTVSGGYQGVYFRGGGGPVGSPVLSGSATPAGQGANSASYYASVSLSHQLNRYYSDSLSFGRESQLGVTSAEEQYYFLSYSSSWKLSRVLGFGTSLSLNDTQESGFGASQHYDQLLASISTGYQLTRRLNMSILYQFTLKLANVRDQGYVQDALTVQFAYSF